MSSFTAASFTCVKAGLDAQRETHPTLDVPVTPRPSARPRPGSRSERVGPVLPNGPVLPDDPRAAELQREPLDACPAVSASPTAAEPWKDNGRDG